MKTIINFLKSELSNFKSPTNIVLSIQHCLAFLGGTILIPILMGLPPTLGLLSAGVGTLIYAFVTKGQVPIFMGSSAGYLGAFVAIKSGMGMGFAIGALIGASFAYAVMATIIKKVGTKVIKRIFPSTVAGSVIIVIGVTLVPVALSMASTNFILALMAGVLMILFCSSKNRYIKRFPVLLAIIVSYLVAVFMGVVDFAPVLSAPWFALPFIGVTPIFSLPAMGIMAITALITMLEHIGEFTTNGLIVGRDHFEETGLHRSFFADSITLLLSGLFLGVPLTTYGENTAVISVTGNKNPALIRMAGLIAIILSLFGKFGALLATIPMPIIGGISFILFGMIAMAGFTTIKEADVNLMDFRNSVVVFLPIFIGVASLLAINPLVIVVSSTLTLSGLSLSAIVGVGLNLLFEIFKKKE
jgi:uracil permease